MKKYRVRLEPQEREQLQQLVNAGRIAGYKIKHANLLLMADSVGRMTDEQIAEGLDVSVGQCEHLRKRFVEQGLDACLQRKKQERPSVEPKFDGEKEAQLLASACSQAPAGYARWSLRLLADRVVQLRIADSTSHETVRRTLRKTR
jgi:transposase